MKFMNFKLSKKHVLFYAILFFLPLFYLPALPAFAAEDAPQAQSEEKPLVIVIDPGHGGKDQGGAYDGFVEKEMTLATAKAMQETLSQYEGVEVYLTRTGDQKLTLDERAAFAKRVNADFLFCLHYNLAADHGSYFGAECWVSAFGARYSEGKAFAQIEMEALTGLGLYSRGIKTRIGKDGLDYYGIIRHAREQDITCVIIEHCHMDHPNDRPFCEGKEQWGAFGRLDADSAAKYFRLRSESLGKDYRDYAVPQIPVPDTVMRPDKTEPELCRIELVEQKAETGEITLELAASDADSGLLYYDYSCDGGETFSPLLAWGDQSQSSIRFTLQAPPEALPRLLARVYNGYDLVAESNRLDLPSMDYETKEERLGSGEALAVAAQAKDEREAALEKAARKEEAQKNYVEIHRAAGQPQAAAPSLSYFLAVCLVCALLVIAMALSVALILGGRRRRRRRRRK